MRGQHQTQPGSPEMEAPQGGSRHQGDSHLRVGQKHPGVYQYSDGRRRPLEEALGTTEKLKEIVRRGDLLAFADDMLILTNSQAGMT